jgi:transcription factor TFIIIB component B''
MSTRSGHSLSAVSKEPDQQADIPTPALDPSLVSPSQPPVPTSAPHIAIPSLPPPPEMPMHSLMFASSHAPPGAPPIPYYPPYQAPPAFQWPQWYPHVLSSQQQPGSQPPNFPTSPYGHVGYPMHPGIMPPAVLPPPLPNTSTELPATAETYPPPPSGSPFPQELDVVPHDEGVSANPDQDQGQEQMAFAPQIDPSLLGSEPMQSNDASSMISAPTRLQLPPSLSPADLTSTSQSVDIVLLDPASLDGAEPAAPEPPSRHRPRRKKAVAAQAENTERSTSTSQPPTRLRRKTKAAIATINGESSITPKQRKPRAKKSKAVADEEGDYEGEGGEGGVAVEAGTEGAGASTSVKTKATAKKRKRAAKSPSATPGPKRKRQESVVVPYNVDADPGEEPDPTTLSMADLITDMPRGRVSSKAAEVINNHATWKAASKAKRAALRARVEAKKYGRTEDDEMENRNGNGGSNENGHGKAEEGAVKRSGSQAVNRAPSEEVVLNEKDDGPVAGPSHADIGMNMDDDDEDNAHEKDDDDFDYNQNLKTNKFTVQVRIGPNGETIVDEQSLFVDRNDEEDETAGYTHIEESDLTKFVNSMTHTKKTNGSRWSDEETEMFYDVSSFCAI